MIKINATILEDGLVEDLEKLIKENKELFEGSQVALMPDAHKTNSIPVGFTMTVPHYRVAPDFISSDISCGMSSILIKGWQPNERELKNLSFVVRDLVQVNRRYDQYYNSVTDLGTLGGGKYDCLRTV